MIRFLLSMFFPFIFSQASAAPGHHHGEAQLAVIIQEKLLTIEFRADLSDLVGFEHEPRTAEEKLAIIGLHDQLKTIRPPFDLPEKADCSPTMATTEGGFLEQLEHAEDHDHHEEHGEDHILIAHWVWECAAPKKLGRIETALFELFPSITEINVAMLTDVRQAGAKLTAKNKVLRLP